MSDALPPVSADDLDNARAVVGVPASKPLHAWRCCRCGRLLLRVWLAPGSFLEITCPQCGERQMRESA